MKKKSKLAVLLVAVLVCVMTLAGAALATGSGLVETNISVKEIEDALSLLQITTLTDENITLDLSKGNISITSSGFTAIADDGSVLTGTSSNITVITSSPTSNSITLSGSNLNCNLTLNNVQTSSEKGVKFENTDSSCNVKILLAGDNSIGQLFYIGDAKLKITSASGDGNTEGRLTVTASAGWSAAIGGDDGVNSSFSGLTIAGGTIVATATNGAAIGGAGNDSAIVTITGGHVTATNNGNSATIGGGGGQTGAGGAGTVIVRDGTVVATNNGAGVAIGGGSTDAAAQATGAADVYLLGGNVTAFAKNNYAISGGYNTSAKTYAETTVEIGADVVYSGSINPNATIRSTLIFDLAQQSVVFHGNEYSGKDSAGNLITGTHVQDNRYIVRQSGSGSTANVIQLNDAISGTVHLEIDGIHSTTLNSIDIPAASGMEKDVVLYLSGENRINNLRYYTSAQETSKKNDQSNSTLKITSADGDGSTAGSLLVNPPTLSELNVGIYYNAGIGGTDGCAGVAGLTISGGTIEVTVDATHDCSAIGGGGNGYAQITITGGRIVAENASTGATIGGGVGYTAPGSGCDILITGGTVIAKNNGKYKNDHGVTGQVYGVAIGGGSSYKVEALGDEANVTIKGGTVTAEVEHGQTAIGAGNSCMSNAGNATVNISGGAINCIGGIGGGSSVHANGGDCTVIISGGNITVDNQAGACIGGGTGKTSGGDAIVNISAGTLKTGSIGGGLATGDNAPIGRADVTISGGQIQGQVVMAAGTDASNPCKFLMTDGTIDNANSRNFYFIRDVGGAVYVENGTATVQGGTIKNCGSVHQASDKNGQFEYGGAFYVTGGNFIMTGGTLEGNTAARDGGAVYVTEGNVIIGTQNCSADTHPVLQNNSAVNGGAIAVAGATPIMYCGTMKNNTASQNGGAVYVTGGGFDMVYGTLDGNQAINGGAIYVSGGNAYVKSGFVNNNNVKIKAEAAGATDDKDMGYGGAIFAIGGDVVIGIEDCDGKTNTLHREYTHPEITDNIAIFGGALAVRSAGNQGGNVTIYCCNMHDNKSDNAGTGSNVFMKGDSAELTHWFDSAVIGTANSSGIVDDHGIVSVGGQLNVAYHDQSGNIKNFTIRIVYDSQKESYAEWTGTAPEGYRLNLPYCRDDWENVNPNDSFVGWSVSPISAGYVDTVRDRNDYEPIGTPITLQDQDGDPNNDEGRMTFYAVWADSSSKISYAYALGTDTVTPIVNVADDYADTGVFKLYGSPREYEYTNTQQKVKLKTPAYAGYEFVRWDIYAGNEMVSNWNADLLGKKTTDDPLALTLSNIRNSNNNDDMTDTSSGIPAPDATFTDSWTELEITQKFGHITLVAVFKPAYANLTIAKTGVTDAQKELDTPNFMFKIEGTPDDSEIEFADMIVVIANTDEDGKITIMELPVGQYTVTEIANWGWRYMPDNISRSIKLEKLEESYELTFKNTREETQWLDGEDYKPNKFN